MKKHITYIDGLKGFCAILVIVFHYLLAFDVQGFIGWNSGIALPEQWEHFWTYFPLSIFTNASYALYMFFSIIAFIPAYTFFLDADKQWIQKQAIIRYFRFVPYTFFLVLISYIIHSLGWYFNQELGQALHEPWALAVLSPNMSFGGAVWIGLIGAMTTGAGDYLTSLWCMHIIFIGSYFVYATLFFFGEIRNRFILYLFLFILLYNVPFYSLFVVGIAVADIHVTKNLTLSLTLQKILFALGLFCAFIAEAPWYALNLEFMQGSIIQYFLRNFGIFSILLIVCKNVGLQKFFSHKIFLHCSRYCFEYILVHVLILFSLSSWIFLQAYNMWGYGIAFLIAFVTAIPLNIIGVLAFSKLLQPLSAYLSQKAYAFFMGSN